MWRNAQRSTKLVEPNEQKGPGYGYHPKASKSQLVVKEVAEEEAKRLFNGTGIQITTDGRRLLGAAVGTEEFEEKLTNPTYVSTLVQQVTRLAEVAQTQPQAAHAAFTHGLTGKWTFLTRTINSTKEHLQPLEDTIQLRNCGTIFATSHRRSA